MNDASSTATVVNPRTSGARVAPSTRDETDMTDETFGFETITDLAEAFASRRLGPLDYALLNDHLDVPTDERDRLITMRAERYGGWFVAGGATLGLLLIIADVESFWTANAILAGLVIGQIVEYASMLISYRRGI